jgi:hypothetical protein
MEVSMSAKIFLLGFLFAQTTFAIVNGTPVEEGDPVASHTVYIYKKDTILNKTTACTGTLIGERLVLTAGHCMPKVEDTHIQMVVSFGLFKPQKRPGAIEILPEKFLKHPKFTRGQTTPNAHEYDLGLILLSEDAPVGFYPVSLLENHQEILNEGTSLIVAGYGAITNEPKSPLSERLLKAIVEVSFTEKDRVIVDQSKGVGACNGDSGGPNFYEDESGELFQVAVVRGPYPREAPHCLIAEQGNVPSFYKDFLFEVADSWGVERPNIVSLEPALN